MSIFQLRFQGLLALALTIVVAGGCKAPDPETPFATTATIKDLMLSIIDTNADVVWLSVSTVHSEKGTIETQPRTDEEWAAVRHGALALAEASNLLMMPGRRVARPGEKSETPGVELEPEEMDVLINKDRNAWNARAKELHAAAMAVLAAAEAKDPQKVFELGDGIERACENCHTQYWYPNEVKPGPVTVTGTSGN
jgi:cytochrome c556